MAREENNALAWDDTIGTDSATPSILEEGDYDFEVISLEKGSFPGSQKISPCPKAMLTLGVNTPEGTTKVRTDILLSRCLEWKISEFFRSIGKKRHGEKIVMNWDAVVGAKGRAHIVQRTYTTKSGNPKTVNDVDHYIDYVADDDDEPLPF